MIDTSKFTLCYYIIFFVLYYLYIIPFNHFVTKDNYPTPIKSSLIIVIQALYLLYGIMIQGIITHKISSSSPFPLIFLMLLSCYIHQNFNQLSRQIEYS